MATRYMMGLLVIFLTNTQMILAEESLEKIVEKTSEIFSENISPNSQNISKVNESSADNKVPAIQNVNDTLTVVYIYPSPKNGRSTKIVPEDDIAIYEESTTPVYVIYPAKVKDWTPRDDENDTGNTIEVTGLEGRDDSPSNERRVELQDVPKRDAGYFTPDESPKNVSFKFNPEGKRFNNTIGDIIVGKRVSAVNSPAKLIVVKSENYFPKDFYRYPSRKNKVADTQNDKLNAKNSALRERLSHLSHIRQKNKSVKRIPGDKRRFPGQSPSKFDYGYTESYKRTNISNTFKDNIKIIKEKPQYVLDTVTDPIITNDKTLKDGNVFESIKINTAIKVTKTHNDYKGEIKENGLRKQNVTQILSEDDEPTHTKVINLKVISDGRNESMSFESLENEPVENYTRGPLENIRMIPFTLEDAVTPAGMQEYNERPKRNYLWDFVTKGNSQQHAGIYTYAKPYQRYQLQNTRKVESIPVWPSTQFDSKRADSILRVEKLPKDISNIPIVGDIPKPLTPAYQTEEIYKRQLQLPNV